MLPKTDRLSSLILVEVKDKMSVEVNNAFWQAALAKVDKTVLEQSEKMAKLVLDEVSSKISQNKFTYDSKSNSFCVTINLMDKKFHDGKYTDRAAAYTLGKFIENHVKKATAAQVQIEAGSSVDLGGDRDHYCVLEFYFKQ